ncbi:partial Putative tartrate transporter, partial [Patescibacteria group bacterium]
NEQALYKKVSLRLLPFLFLLYIVAYLDRVNISFAKLQMNDDLGFSDTVYGLGAGIFFIGYLLFEIPSNLLLHRMGAKLWLSRIIIVWGLISMATLWVDSVASFYTLRFLLGVGEAGFFPGIIYYLTLWYSNKRRTQAISLFLLAIPITGVLGSLLSGWIMVFFDEYLGLQGWQWLFIIEGSPAVLLGIISFFVLTDTPDQATWLSDTEKYLLISHIEDDMIENTHANLKELLLSKTLWQLASIYFLLAMGLYGISFWLPQIIHDIGQRDLMQTSLLTAIPYAVAAVGMLIISIHSDKTGERHWHLIACLVGISLGFGLSIVFQHNLFMSLFALSLATLSVLSAIAIFWAIPTAFLSGRFAAGGIAFINALGNLSGYLSPALLGWLKDLTQQMTSSLWILTIIPLLTILLVMGLKFKANNKMR